MTLVEEQKSFAKLIADAIIDGNENSINKAVELANVKTKMENLTETNSKEHCELKASIDSFGLTLKEISDKMDTKYSSKWVENLVRWFLYFIGAGIISFMGYYFWELIKSVSKYS